MERLAAVRFNNVGKYYYFSTRLDLHKGDKVVVETVRGLELGELISELKDTSEFKLDTELKPIIRLANHADLEVDAINKIRAEQAFDICKRIINESELDMHLINCEYTLDASKIIFMYTSDERVDFRELLKKLAAEFKCRIELRQVGPRDKAKIVGGIGNCGLPLCCSSFLGEFDGISINMAKNQLLAINIDKISGACGRLLCCLKYEDEAYKEIKKKFPKIGSHSTFNKKDIKVVGLNVLNDLVKIDNQGNISFITLDEFNKGMSIEVLKEIKEAEQEKQKAAPKKQKPAVKNQLQQQTKSNPKAKNTQQQNKKPNVQKYNNASPKQQAKQKNDHKSVKEPVKQKNINSKPRNKNNQNRRNDDKVKKNQKPANVEKKADSNNKNQNRNKKRYYNNKRRQNNQKNQKGPVNGQS